MKWLCIRLDMCTSLVGPAVHSDWNGNRVLNLLCDLALNYHSIFLLNFASEKSE